MGIRPYLLRSSALALVLVTGTAASDTRTYTYDALGRLVTTTNAGGPNDGRTNGLCYDPAGNRATFFSGTGAAPTCTSTPTPTPSQACYAAPALKFRYSQGPEHNSAEVGGGTTDVTFYGYSDCPGGYNQPMYVKATVTNNGTTQTITASGTYQAYLRGQTQTISSTQNVGGTEFTVSMGFLQDGSSDYICSAAVRLTPTSTPACS